MCGKKRGRRSKEDIWWWNEEVKEAVSRRKEAYKLTCQNSNEGNKRRYKSMKNKANKAVSKAMRDRAEKMLNKLKKLPKLNAWNCNSIEN